MAEPNGSSGTAPLSERWAAVDDYFVCITECSLDDGTCVTRCMETHLKQDGASGAS
ncbi:hypothetical protein KR49_03055 [Synechococcus sp. KORDI-49]|jgi:hypothetical protein|uniref:hypothetical protein n=1 Tax=Synechococcales TaxID=1890424 RepID=UPI0004E089BE|nr:hypothetical protein [Synechococcus sp. KORDI-49]AII45442.1 hypothetical protein KR49_03055 [Synechococcus sp. KORDI-49]|tara:strand:- start:22653 stop:22820 length:168 start_codon:yes stop_codon:yes gene_type:complete